MGYIAHDAVIVTVNDWHQPMPDVDAFREQMPAELRHLVVGPIPSALNGYLTWFFAPDGSKEGWDESNEGDVWRERFAALFRGDGSGGFVDAVGVRYGGDFGVECGITATDLGDADDDD